MAWHQSSSAVAILSSLTKNFMLYVFAGGSVICFVHLTALPLSKGNVTCRLTVISLQIKQTDGILSK